MQSIADLLMERNVDEPSEIVSLRKYCQTKFNVTPKIKVYPENILVIMPNSAIASELRMSYLDVKRRCQLTKKLIIKVG